MRINEMQRKLATWTATDENRRVNRLLRVISQPLWLSKAAEITLSSKGAKTPGVDGINKDALQEGLDEYLREIRIDLLSGNYRPSPARRIYIPKANGKQRPIGIPKLLSYYMSSQFVLGMFSDIPIKYL
jgi:retron-type reverse transcriptase